MIHQFGPSAGAQRASGDPGSGLRFELWACGMAGLGGPSSSLGGKNKYNTIFINGIITKLTGKIDIIKETWGFADGFCSFG